MAGAPGSIPVPHCPHCDADLPGVALYSWHHGIWLILCIYCTDCLKTIHFQVAPIGIAEEQRIQIPS